MEHILIIIVKIFGTAVVGVLALALIAGIILSLHNTFKEQWKK